MAKKQTDQQMLDESHRLQESDRLAEAEVLYRKVLRSHPYHPDLLNALGIVVGQQGRLEDSINLIERAIAASPSVAEYHNNLGESYRRARQWERAIASFRRAVELKPGYAEGHNSLGSVLRITGSPHEALAAIRRAIELRPDLADVQSNLGNILWSLGRPDEAIVAYRRAIEINPAYSHAHSNLGVVLADTGRVSEALTCFRNATVATQKGDESRAASNYLFALHYQADCDAQTILSEHRAWAGRYAEPLASEIQPHNNDRSPARKLRVGYLSPDFHEHPVGHLLVPLFSHLDRRETEIVCYNDIPVGDAVTMKLKCRQRSGIEPLSRLD